MFSIAPQITGIKVQGKDTRKTFLFNLVQQNLFGFGGLGEKEERNKLILTGGESHREMCAFKLRTNETYLYTTVESKAQTGT